MSRSLSPLSQMLVEDDVSPLVVPELSHEEAFAEFDAFYGYSPSPPSPIPPSLPPLPVDDDDEFAGLMESLDEIERFEQPPHHDQDSMMSGGSPTMLPNSSVEMASSYGLVSGHLMSGEQVFHTPSLEAFSRPMDSARGSSIAPSTGGHRSSLQGEMRLEEDELSNAPLGNLPGFPGYGTNVNNHSEEVAELLSFQSYQHDQQVQNVSSSPDIPLQQIRPFVRPAAKQRSDSSRPSIDSGQFNADIWTSSPSARATVDRIEPRTNTAAQNNLKRARRPSSPFTVPEKRPRHLATGSAPGPPRRPSQQGTVVARNTSLGESDSSLTDISLSEILASQQADRDTELSRATRENSLLQHSPGQKERRDSANTSLLQIKSEVMESTTKASGQLFQKVPKSQSKRNISAPSDGPGSSKVTKTRKTPSSTAAATATAKAKQPAGIKTNELKGLISAGILGDVLKPKGPRQTRGAKKIDDENKPDAASAAKRRHNGEVNNYRV